MKLSEIENVDIRNIWKHEERDFNKWIAEKGIKLLMKEIGFDDVEVLDVEKNVGDFYADLVVKVSDLEGDKTLVIESQLTKTDHDHLGKLLTYSAGLNADYIVWIAPEIREEHKNVIDWLNNIVESSDQNIGFFLVKIEVWKIENSPPAPKFTIVSAPNNWTKIIRKRGRTSSSSIGEKGKASFNFLSELYSKLSNYLPNLRPPSISTSNAYEIRLGTSKAYIRIGINVSQKYIRVGYVFEKELFNNFQSIEKELKSLFPDEELRIENPENYKRYAFADIFKYNADIQNEGSWPELIEWLQRSVITLKNFFEKNKNKLLYKRST